MSRSRSRSRSLSWNRSRCRLWAELVLLLLAALIPLLQAGIVTDPDTSTASTMDPHSEESLAKADGVRSSVDCKLTFDAATMDSLGCHNEEPVVVEKPGAWPSAGAGMGNKPEEEKEEEGLGEQELQAGSQLQRHLKAPDSQPIYELQLVVWPSDIEDGDDFSPPLATTTGRTTTTSSTPKAPEATSSASPIEQIWPLYEDQLVVFPQMDFEEENLDYFFDDSGSPPSPAPAPAPSPSPTPSPGPASTSVHPTGTPTPTPIYVVQNYHVIHPNGTEEYKLVMSNGLVNYKKIYTKTVKDQVINVQEGYNSVPIPGPKNQIQTQYYIADERGYNVYRIEVHYQQPGQPKQERRNKGITRVHM
nr:uncharacterized protein LOC108071678 [Drosophila kikkawai]